MNEIAALRQHTRDAIVHAGFLSLKMLECHEIEGLTDIMFVVGSNCVRDLLKSAIIIETGVHGVSEHIDFLFDGVERFGLDAVEILDFLE